jgi:transposase-like protein
MSKKAELNEKHWKAIELISEGKNSIKEIAQILDFKPDTLYKLIEGSPAMGSTSILFKAELKKIRKKDAEWIKDSLNSCKRKNLRILDSLLTRILALDYTSNEDGALAVTVFNALNKAPSVEINATSYSIYNNMSSEEIMYEFNRLTSLARGTSVRGGIPQIGPGSAKGVSSGLGSSDSVEQGSEA